MIISEGIGTFLVLLIGFIILPALLNFVSNRKEKKSELKLVNAKPIIIPDYDELRARKRSFKDLRIK